MKINLSSPWTAVITGIVSFASGVAADRYLLPKEKPKDPFKRARKAASSANHLKAKQETEENDEVVEAASTEQ